MEKFKAAIVGCGGIAQVHAKVLASLEKAELVACADIRPERADKLAGEYGAQAYYSLNSMLDAEEIDVLHICTPHYLHTPMAKLAAEKGIAVFTEKPPVISEEQWEELMAIKDTVPVGVCFQNRYNRSVKYIEDILESGDAGKILGARAVVTWSRGEKYYTESGWRGALSTEGGGVLINQSIHTLDLLIRFMGKPVSAEASCINHHLKGIIEVEDTLEAYIDFGEAKAVFFATTAYSADSPVMIELNCENMTIRMEENRIFIKYRSGSEENINIASPEPLGKSYWGNGHYNCISDYYAHLAAGDKPSIGLEDVALTAKTMLAIYRSARESHAPEVVI